MRNFFHKLSPRKLTRSTLWFITMALFGVVIFYLLAFVMGPFSPMSRFPAAILLSYIGILALMYMDKIHHADINTTLAIKENNVSYALIILSYAIIIAAVISTV